MAISDCDCQKLLDELVNQPGIDESAQGPFRAGAKAALTCRANGGFRHDGITLENGVMKCWKPNKKFKLALAGWEWMWDRIDRLFADVP
jgi:hypothetical protein